MSLKPTKKTDLGKAWLRGRAERAKAILIHPEYHLIVTEGTKTKPLYFEAIKEKVNRDYKGRINVKVEVTGHNTVGLVNRAMKLVSNSANGYKHVWVVYDKDDFTSEDFNHASDLCSSISTETTVYHALWSNQCIELWFLLHFDFFHSDIHRDGYYPKLSGYLGKIGAGEYKRNRSDMYDVLRPYMDRAILFAKKLAKVNEGRKPSECVPGTEVYKIVEMLRAYL